MDAPYAPIKFGKGLVTGRGNMARNIGALVDTGNTLGANRIAGTLDDTVVRMMPEATENTVKAANDLLNLNMADELIRAGDSSIDDIVRSSLKSSGDDALTQLLSSTSNTYDDTARAVQKSIKQNITSGKGYKDILREISDPTVYNSLKKDFLTLTPEAQQAVLTREVLENQLKGQHGLVKNFSQGQGDQILSEAIDAISGTADEATKAANLKNVLTKYTDVSMRSPDSAINTALEDAGAWLRSKLSSGGNVGKAADTAIDSVFDKLGKTGGRGMSFENKLFSTYDQKLAKTLGGYNYLGDIQGLTRQLDALDPATREAMTTALEYSSDVYGKVGKGSAESFDQAIKSIPSSRKAMETIEASPEASALFSDIQAQLRKNSLESGLMRDSIGYAPHVKTQGLNDSRRMTQGFKLASGESIPRQMGQKVTEGNILNLMDNIANPNNKATMSDKLFQEMDRFDLNPQAIVNGSENAIANAQNSPDWNSFINYLDYDTALREEFLGKNPLFTYDVGDALSAQGYKSYGTGARNRAIQDIVQQTGSPVTNMDGHSLDKVLSDPYTDVIFVKNKANTSGGAGVTDDFLRDVINAPKDMSSAEAINNAEGMAREISGSAPEATINIMKINNVGEARSLKDVGNLYQIPKNVFDSDIVPNVSNALGKSSVARNTQKVGALTKSLKLLNPPTHLKNLTAGELTNILEGVNPFYPISDDAYDMYRALNADETLAYGDLANYSRYSPADAGVVERTLDKANTATNSGLTKLYDAIENPMRTPVFSKTYDDMISQGASKFDAAMAGLDEVNRLHFDYRDVPVS